MLRICFLHHDTRLYGATRSLLNLIDGLKQYDVLPYVIIPSKGDIVTALESKHINFDVVSLEWWVYRRYKQDGLLENILYNFRQTRYILSQTINSFKTLQKLSEKLLEWKIDVVYSNSTVIPLGALVAQKLKLPHVWHLREFVDLDYNFSYNFGKPLASFLISKSQAKIAVSKAVKRHILGNFPCHVIYNGVISAARAEELRKIAISKLENYQSIYTFVIAGLIKSEKGQSMAISALSIVAKEYPNVKLLIVGHGDTAPLKQLAISLAVETKVEFCGYIDDPYQIYLRSDALLMCSPNEAMGRVTVEAMTACLPVIGFDNGGTSELVIHNYTGLLYKNGVEELANCMGLFIKDRSWSKCLGFNGWKIAHENYTIEACAKSVYDVLESINRH